MPSKIEADASPEKRLFAYLITRDISLADAILDLIDNSINAALQPLAKDLKTADDYQEMYIKSTLDPDIVIKIKVDSGRISIEDNAYGIPLDSAKSDIFKFGRNTSLSHHDDRLSVYGIGLKRAMFKCGNKVAITSDHVDGGFALDLEINKWEKRKQDHWTFDITGRPPKSERLGTKIVITQLYDDVIRRVSDGVFVNQLRERIARTYTFFIGRIVKIELNDISIDGSEISISDNYASERFSEESVSCNITAGIALSNGETFKDKNAGWFVFCNGRAVLSADKTSLTGWSGNGLPIFQPKHRPFVGTVFFVSSEPEELPWTTTKASINEENAVWQTAKQHMIKVGRVITGFLDSRYGEEGTSVSPAELQTMSQRGVSVLSAATSLTKKFDPPKPSKSQQITIQYKAKIADLQAIEKYLRRPNMGGSEVGRYTFNWFLKNEVES